MATRTYEVIGKYALPDDFTKYVYGTLTRGSTPRIKARRVDLDELAAKRHPEDEKLNFRFDVSELFRHDAVIILGGHRLDTGEWLRIDVRESVRFDVIS